MMRVLVASLLIVGATGAAASPAWAGWTPVIGAVSKAGDPLVWWDPKRSPDTASYWSTPVAAPGGEVDIDVVTVPRSAAGQSPSLEARRVRLDCETGVGRVAWLGRVRAGDAAIAAQPTLEWSGPRFYGQAGAYDLTAFACGATGAKGELPSLKAVADNAAGQLGFDPPLDPNRPPPPLAIPRAPVYDFTPAERKGLGPQDLVWERPGKAVFVMTKSLTRADSVVSGKSMWLSGAGAGEEQQGYLIRDFQADCAARSLGLAATDFWPRLEFSTTKARPGQPARRPPATEAEAALLANTCSEKPASRSLASVSELLAYAEAPTGDLAFIARRQVTLSALRMLWAKTPSKKALAGALPPGTIPPGKDETSVVQCVVGRDYRLQECKAAKWGDPTLLAAHMTLIDQFKPERSVNQQDTMGRRVDSLIEWTSEGGRLKPVLVPPDQMRWALLPTIKAVERAYGRPTPASATLFCRVGPARLLDECSVMVGRGAASKRITDPDAVAADATPDEAFGAAMLRVSGSFVPALLTSIGESTAGRAVMIPVSWPMQ